MTTIAIKNGVIAADTMTCSPTEIRAGTTSKLRRIESGEVIALMGKAVHAFPLAEWYKDGCEGDQPEGRILVVKPTGEVEIYEDGGRQPAGHAEFHAFGSGSQLAIGAMAAGASAEQAVQIACAFDVWSGGPIETIVLGSDQSQDDVEEDEDIESEPVRLHDLVAVALGGDEPASKEPWKAARGL